jgi:hypothetical protein
LVVLASPVVGDDGATRLDRRALLQRFGGLGDALQEAFTSSPSGGAPGFSGGAVAALGAGALTGGTVMEPAYWPGSNLQSVVRLWPTFLQEDNDAEGAAVADAAELVDLLRE